MNSMDWVEPTPLTKSCEKTLEIQHHQLSQTSNYQEFERTPELKGDLEGLIK